MADKKITRSGKGCNRNAIMNALKNEDARNKEKSEKLEKLRREKNKNNFVEKIEEREA